MDYRTAASHSVGWALAVLSCAGMDISTNGRSSITGRGAPGQPLNAPPDSAFFGLHVHKDMQGAAYRRTAVLGLPIEYSGRFPLLGNFL